MADGQVDEQEPLHQQEAESSQEKVLHTHHPPSLDDALGVVCCLLESSTSHRG